MPNGDCPDNPGSHQALMFTLVWLLRSSTFVPRKKMYFPQQVYVFFLTENDIYKFSNKQTNSNKYAELLIPKWKYFCVILEPRLWLRVMLCWLLLSVPCET